jgi:hypothetical protein
MKIVATKKAMHVFIKCEEHVDHACYCDGVVHHKFILQGQIISQHYHTGMMWCLQENICHKPIRNAKTEMEWFIMIIFPLTPPCLSGSCLRTEWPQFLIFSKGEMEAERKET